MPLAPYRRVLSVPALRQALVLGVLVRIPIFAGGVILTLHVVQTLGRSYGAAGLVTAAATVCIAVSGPWRGRLLDTRGLRPVVLPSLVVMAICWSIAPFVGYLPLLLLAALAGLFVVPTFSIIRQIIINAVPPEQRRAALSLDSIATELSFMAGPALGVWAATVWDTSWAILVFEWLSIVAGTVLWVLNPRLRGDHDASAETPVPPRREWLGLPLFAVLAAAAASTVVLSGSDVSIIASLRALGAQQHIGWVLALWAFGSVLGGVVYGAWHRSVSVFWLLGGLALATAPVALATGLPVLVVLLVISGIFCAPTITATVDHLSRIVPERARGEAMGWHGSSMTAGSALGAPIAGFAIDGGGWPAGFVSVSAAGLLVAMVGALAVTRRRVPGPVSPSLGRRDAGTPATADPPAAPRREAVSHTIGT